MQETLAQITWFHNCVLLNRMADPLDTRVVVLGYESGYDDVTEVREINIVPEENPAWYNTRYRDAPPERANQAERGVLVYGRNREDFGDAG